VARQPHLAVAGDADRGRAKAAHGDAGFVERGHARQDGRPKCGSCRGCERTARQQSRERRSFVGFDGDPDPVRVGAPCEHRRQRRVPVVGEPLNTRDRSGRFRGRHWNLVDDRRLAVLEHGFPPGSRSGSHELDQLRLGLALGHHGCMVTLRTVAYVIVQPCVGVKDASCVEVCPVDCIHTDDAATMYYIDPDECIDCGACVDPCPVDAIFPEDEVPEQWRDFIKINADYFKNR
jgi:ferredoxin